MILGRRRERSRRDGWRRAVSRIFISYRRHDAEAWAVLLRDRLADAFRRDEIFRDEDALAPGPWRAQIREALERCEVVLVVIGRGWLPAADERGRRLEQPDDIHRQEIEMALGRPGITVIPVLVEGVSMPRSEDLPASIQALSGWQSRTLSGAHRRRQADLQILVSDIARITGLEPRRRVTGTRWVATGLRVLVITIGTTTTFLIGAHVIGGWTFRPEDVSAIALAILVVATGYAVRRARARRALDDADE
jgi:TIR domain